MLNDILSVRKGEFNSGTHTELRGQLNRSRRVTLLSGSVVGNARSDGATPVSSLTRRSYFRASSRQLAPALDAATYPMYGSSA